MRLILLIILAFFLYWFFKNIFWPALKAYLLIRNSRKHFQRQYRQKTRKHPEGHVEVHNTRPKSGRGNPGKEDEYIDYEEIK